MRLTLNYRLRQKSNVYPNALSKKAYEYKNGFDAYDLLKISLIVMK